MTLRADKSERLLRLCRQAQGAVRRYRAIFACVGACGILALVAALLEAFDRVVSLRENWALVLVVLGILLAGISWVLGIFRSLFRGPTATDLALNIEREHPELKDAFVCAMEVAQRPAEKRRVLEKALLERVASTLDCRKLLRESAHNRYHFGRLLGLGLLFAGALGLMLQSTPVQKARFRFRDLMTGQESGIVLSGFSSPVAEHSDVRIQAIINRWEPDATIEYTDAEGKHSFEMNSESGRTAHFTFYDVTAPIQFRVTTRSLSSSRYTIETFRPPTFDAVKLELVPPAYTRRDSQIVDGFRACSTVAGSRMKLTVTTGAGVQGTLVSGTEEWPMVSTGTGELRIERTISEDFVFSVKLQSPEGWEAAGPETVIRSEPDLPPVASILKPRKDSQIKLSDVLEIEGRATDDFGVQDISIVYSVSGGERQRLSLYSHSADAGVSVDEGVFYDLNPKELGLHEGDVVSYALSAQDNRDPDPQSSVTEVQFVFIRPDLNQQEQDGEGQQQQKMDVSGLIAELKRLIRFTWDLLHAPPSVQPERMGALSRDLKDLRLEVSKKMNELEKMAGGPMGGTIPQLMKTAETEISQAASLADRSLAEESLPSQERALASLVAVENELMKNAVKSKQGESGESEDQGEDKKPKEQQETSQSPQSRREKLEALRKATDEIRRLAEKQDQLNQDIRQEQNSTDSGIARGLAEKQESLGADGKRVSDAIGKIPEAERAKQDLASALREMGRGEEQLRKTRMKAGEQHGIRAQHMLQAAARSLEDAYRKAAANEIAQLANAAQGLADEQRKQAAQSREFEAKAPSKAALDAARSAQKELEEANKTLQDAISETAGQLQDTYPEASRALAEAGVKMSESGIDRKMKRAGNALLYKRFPRARTEQTDAANALQNIAGSLQDAGKLLPSMSREELLEAMQRMQQRAQQTKEAMAQPDEKGMEKLEKIREDALREMDQLSAALQDQRLQQLADDMSMPLVGNGVGEGGRRLLGMFQAALSTLEKHLLAAEMKRRMELSRDASEPPEKYRRLVEQYFKILSREQ